MKTGVGSQELGVTPRPHRGQWLANRARRSTPSPFLGRGERELARDADPSPCHRIVCRNGIRNKQGERGSATILVLALVVIMMVFLTTNQRVLHSLKREVRLVEQQQLKKFQPPPAPPAAPPARP